VRNPSMRRTDRGERVTQPTPADDPALNPDSPGHQRTVVVAVDGSTTSLRAASYAIGLSRHQPTRLVGVYVVPRPWSDGYTPDLLSPAWLAESGRQMAAQLLCSAGWDAGADELLVRVGEPSSSLAQVAGELQADLIVVGAASSLRHRLGGSLGARLIRRARCPVVVVP
jgi:nucleotide-binding universal stress UspA family protein